MFQVRHKGQRRTEFLGAVDEKDAEKKAKAVKLRIMGNLIHETSHPATLSTVQVAEIVQDYIDYALEKLKAGKIIKLTLTAHILNIPLSKRKAASITTADLSAYAKLRSNQGAKPATVRNELSYLRAAFNYAKKKTTPPKVAEVPYFPIPKVSNTRTGFLEMEYYDALLEELPASLKLAFVIAHHVGIRKGELLGIRLDQVQLEDEFIVLDAADTKNGTGRHLPIHGDMKKWLSWQLEIRAKLQPRHDKLFFWHPTDVALGHGGCRVSPGAPIRNFTASWRAAVSRMVAKTDAKQHAGLLFHDLRRSAVRNMVQKAKIAQVQAMKISGHLDPTVFNRYNIVARDDVAEAGRQMGAWMERERKPKDP